MKKENIPNSEEIGRRLNTDRPQDVLYGPPGFFEDADSESEPVPPFEPERYETVLYGPPEAFPIRREDSERKNTLEKKNADDKMNKIADSVHAAICTDQQPENGKKQKSIGLLRRLFHRKRDQK